MTERMMRAASNRHVDVIGHPTGRRPGSREGATYDFEAVFKQAAKNGIALEIDCDPACLEWMDRHTPDPRSLVMPAPNLSVLAPAPRWATLRRAVEVAAVKRSTSGSYPFDRFTLRAKKMLKAAQLE